MQASVQKTELGIVWKKLQRALEVTDLVLLDALLVRDRHAVPGTDEFVAGGIWFVVARVFRPYFVQKQSRRAPVLGGVLEPQSASIVEVHHESLGSDRWFLSWRPGLKRHQRGDVGVQQRAVLQDPVLVVANLLVSSAYAKPIQVSLRIKNTDRRARAARWTEKHLRAIVAHQDQQGIEIYEEFVNLLWSPRPDLVERGVRLPRLMPFDGVQPLL